MRSFYEAVIEAFTLDPETACFSFAFGEGYELVLEPLLSGQFVLALYHKHVLMWPDKIPMRPGYLFPQGPGDEWMARRKAIREHLEVLLAQLDKADAEAETQG